MRRNPAAEHLVAAVRAFFGGEGRAEFESRAAAITDWEAITQLAGLHAVRPLLARAILELPADRVPDAVRNSARAYQQQLAFRNLALTGELLRLLRVFEDRGVRAVPFKGPVLAAQIYGDPALRRFDDLDLLFRRDQLFEARDLLAEQGYTMRSVFHWRGDAAQLRSENGEFVMSNGAAPIDVHWRLLPSYFPVALDIDQVWAGLSELRLAGRAAPCFATEHQLLFLAAHGTKHMWSRLGWVCDFARFLQVMRIDWDRAMAVCREASAVRLMSHSLALIPAVLGIAIPSGAGAFRNDAAGARLTEKVASRMFERVDAFANTPERLRYHQGFCASAGEAGRLAWRTLFDPTEAEWRTVQLPRKLYSLYYPIRMARLGYKYLAGGRLE